MPQLETLQDHGVVTSSFCTSHPSSPVDVQNNKMNLNTVKQIVGYKAVDEYVVSGMVVGLGSGSTASHVVDRVGQKLRSGELSNIICVPTSEATRQHAEQWNIPLVTLDDVGSIDVCIDGADEVDGRLQLVKGRGAALLREKMLAQCTKTFVVVVDESKYQPDGLGLSGPMPVEIVKFSCYHVLRRLQGLESLQCCDAKIRVSKLHPNQPLETDNQNYIVDLYFKEPIRDPRKAATDISNIVGVVEHGLFLDCVSVCLVGKRDGQIETLLPLIDAKDQCDV